MDAAKKASSFSWTQAVIFLWADMRQGQLQEAKASCKALSLNCILFTREVCLDDGDLHSAGTSV